jgi:hypothetical protein
MATPHVAGAWALLRQRRPTARVGDVLGALRRTGVAITDTTGLRYSRIDVSAAATAVMNAPATFLTVSLPHGVATDAQGNVYLQYDSGTQVFVAKLTPSAEVLWNTPLGGFVDIGLTGRLAFDPDFGLFLMSEDGRLSLLNPATGALVGQANIRMLPFEATAAYDAALEQVANFSGRLAAFNSSYGDLALFRRGPDLDLFIAGISVGTPYVMRVPLSASGQLGAARVLLSSTLTSAGNVNQPRGLAVDSAGVVLTAMPRIPTKLGSVDGAVSFDAAYNPGISGAPPLRLFGNQDFTSFGMTSVGPGTFYAATGVVGISACGVGGSGALVRIRLSQLDCHTFDRVLTDSRDVAVSGNRAYVTVTSANVVEMFTIDSGSSALSVTIRGSAQGAVTSNIGGLNCSMGTCSSTIPIGASLTLTAVPGTGGTFGGWTGACTGSRDNHRHADPGSSYHADAFRHRRAQEPARPAVDGVDRSGPDGG